MGCASASMNASCSRAPPPCSSPPACRRHCRSAAATAHTAWGAGSQPPLAHAHVFCGMGAARRLSMHTAGHVLRRCAHKHFWSWHPDRRLSAFWRGLDDAAKDSITSMETESEKDEMYRRIRLHKGCALQA